MSKHPFSELVNEYASCLAHMAVTRASDVDRAAKLILKPENLDRYLEAVKGFNVPAAFIGVLDLRESTCNPKLALGQGDPWNKVSTHVPKGKGPFKSWVDAARFYIPYAGLDKNSHPWTMEYACWKGEAWNGFGPRNRGRRTGYLWSGTNLYDPPTGLGGKYVADGKWSATTVDKQIGIIPVLLRIGQLRPDLAIGAALTDSKAPSVVPIVAAPVDGMTGTAIDKKEVSVQTIQHMLNVVDRAELVEDGSYGRYTRTAVTQFQKRNGLAVDGICGPITTAALIAAYHKALGK